MPSCGQLTGGLNREASGAVHRSGLPPATSTTSVTVKSTIRWAPGVRAASYRSQIIALTVLSPQPELARRVAFTWSALSAATHYHGYELPPAAADLHGWLRTVESFVAVGLPPARK